MIKPINKKLNDYDKKYTKIEFDLVDNLPLNKTIEIPMVTLVIRAFFPENNKYYPQVIFFRWMSI